MSKTTTLNRHRATGPKTPDYNELDGMISKYYEMIQKKRKDHAHKFQGNLRRFVLTHGCSEEDIVSEISFDHKASGNEPTAGQLFLRAGHELPPLRKVEDTLRGRLWRVVLGVEKLNAQGYMNLIRQHMCRKDYEKIRGDTKRTFLTSEHYKSRVAEERLVRILNSFHHKHPSKHYCQGMDCIAAGLLYAMPELEAYYTFSTLMIHHFPLYFHSDEKDSKLSLIGAYAGAHIGLKTLQIAEPEIYAHIQQLHPFQYLFPVVQSFQAIAQPFTEVQRLWDFLFCFGVHLNPIIAVAQIIANKQMILSQPLNILLQGCLSQRKWMHYQLDAKKVIAITMEIVSKLKSSRKYSKLWTMLLKHCTDYQTAFQIKANPTAALGLDAAGVGVASPKNGMPQSTASANHISPPTAGKGAHIDADELDDSDWEGDDE